MSNQTLKQSMIEFAQSIHGKSNHLLKHVKSALKLILLEALGRDTRAMTPREFDKFCEDWTVEWLIKELQKHDKAVSSFSELVKRTYNSKFNALVDLGIVSKETGKNYSSAIGRWSRWVENQPMLQALCQKELPEILPERIKVQLPKISTRKERYAPRFSELPSQLLEQIAELMRFWTTGGEQEQLALKKYREEARVADCIYPKVSVKSREAFEVTKKYFCIFFGYQLSKGVPPEKWDLKLLNNISEIRGFNQFMLARDNKHANTLRLIEISVAFTKQQNFAVTRRRNWSDISLIQDLRELNQEFNKKYSKEKKLSTQRNLPHRKVTHKQLQQVCQEVLRQCAPFRGIKNPKTGKRVKGAKRPTSAIVWSYQTLVIVLILTYVAPRQQEPRQYQEGVTLVRVVDEMGRERYTVVNVHHKLSHLTRETRSYYLPSILTPYLDQWLQVYRPLAQQAVQTLEGWLAFWGLKPGELERLEQRLKAAEQGEIPARVKNPATYIESLKKDIRVLQRRIAAWEPAKQNFKTYGLAFFTHGRCEPKLFGQPLSSGSVCSLVTRSVAQATQRFYSRTYRVNPHSFRHIAALHVGKIGGNKAGTAELLGHSEETFDDYRASWQDGLDGTADLDIWW